VLSYRLRHDFFLSTATTFAGNNADICWQQCNHVPHLSVFLATRISTSKTLAQGLQIFLVGLGGIMDWDGLNKLEPSIADGT